MKNGNEIILSFSPKEVRVLEKLTKKVKAVGKKSKSQLIVAMVGLVGSGKSSVTRELAKIIGATIVEGDVIRVLLRRENERLDNASKIGELAALEILKQGGNVIFDSDYVSPEKRKRIAEIAKDFGAKMILIRTFADYDVMAGRTISLKYPVSSFFGGAVSPWQGSSNNIGAVVKLREIWRRTPHHYVWRKNFPGGHWVLKKLPFEVFAVIDTTKAGWILDIREAGKNLLNL